MQHHNLNFRTFCITILAWSNYLAVYPQDILWEKSFGGKHAEYLFDAQPTADYGFILAGSSLSDKSGNKTDDNQGDLDYWVWKMDEKGELEWQKSFGGSGSDLLQSIKNTRDGGFILAGTSSSNPLSLGQGQAGVKKDSCRGVTDFWVIKLDAKGEEQWQKTIGGSGQDDVLTVFQTRDGGYMVGGSSSSSLEVNGNSNFNGNSNSNVNEKNGKEKPDLYGKTEHSRGNMDYWIVKLDKEGTVLWQKTYGGDYADLLRSMEQTKDGGYILGGYSNSPQSGEKVDANFGIGDYWIVKIDGEGEIEWQKTYGGNEDDQLYAIQQTEDGGYVAGGNSNSTGALTAVGGSVRNGTDYWIIKMDENGDLVWSETYDFGKVDILTSLVENKDHTYLVGGYSSPKATEGESTTSSWKGGEKKKVKDPEGINDYIALKISEKGEILWEQTVGSDGEDILKKLIETRDGGYLLAGTSNAQSVSGVKRNGMEKNNKGEANEQFQNATDELNNTITDAASEVNNAIKDKLTDTTDAVNDAINQEPGSGFKLGLNTPTGALSLPSLGSGNSGKASNSSKTQNEKQLPASRDKHTSFGSNDFWVVKLKDKTKPKVIKVDIEAIPNPTATFTNIIIGYEFETGTATVVDMMGRTLQHFAITSRTVPVDLSQYPAGVYVVNIKTNVQSDGVKVIKGGLN
jgi:flagellar hook-basal body complex protein FliE